MRAFLAVELTDALRAALGEAQRLLASSLGGWRWTPAHSIHLTLRFLGDAAPATIANAAPGWRRAAASVEPFAIRVSGLGVFPSPKRPRVLWAGVAEDPDAGRLAELARRIEVACGAAGFPAEGRPFTPHLTLARAVGGPAQAPASGAGREYGRALVAEVVLFGSELGPHGAVHTPVDRYRLGARPA